MRKCLWLIGVALVASVALAGEGTDLASVVPEDALFYAEVSDLKGVVADFEQSGLRDMIRAVPQVELQFRVATGIVLQVAQQRVGLNLDDFVGKFLTRVAIAQTEGGGPGRPPVFLLDVSQTKADLTKLLKEAVEPALTRVQGNEPAVALADETHADVALRLIRGPNGTLAYAFLGDVFALAEPPALKKLLDARVRRPLATNEAFLKVRKALDTPKGIVAYLNLGQVLTEHRAAVDGNPEAKRFLDLTGLSTVKWVAMASRFDGRGIRDRIHLYTGERQTGLVRLLGRLSPGTSGAAQVLPQSCPLLLSLNFKDGTELWQGIVKLLEEGGIGDGLAKLDEGKQVIQMKLGINFDDDLAGALGGEIFLAANPDYVAEFAAKRRAPTNQDFAYILGARVAKPEALKTTIHRLLAAQPGVNAGIERKVETHQGVEISILTPAEGANRPAYAFVGDYLLVAKSADIIRQCIAAKAANQSLAQSPRFRNVMDAMPARHHAIAYGDIEGLLAALITGPQAAAEGQAQPAIVAILGQLAAQLRGAAITLSADATGVTIESYSRPGLIPLAGAAAALVARQAGVEAPAPRPEPQPKGPKPADF